MILVTGATGNIGSKVVETLLAKGAPVKAGVRSPDKARGLAEKGAELVKFDFTDTGTYGPAFKGCNHVFLFTNMSPVCVEEGAKLVDAAKAAGVEHVVKLSALGCDMEPGIALGRWHRGVEKLIEASGMGWTFLRPNNFMDNFITFYRQPIVHQSAIFMPLGDGAVSYVDARDIAAVAAVALTDPGHMGKAYAITGPAALTVHQVAAILGKAIGKEVNYIDIPEEAARQATAGMGMPGWLVDAMAELNAIDKAGYASGVTTAVADVTGLAPITFEKWAADHAGAFK
jgi:uncharacterized protein YbjT (DUF2867 family)